MAEIEREGESASSLSRREARDWRECMRIWPTWSSLSGQKKSGKRFSISKEEKGS